MLSFCFILSGRCFQVLAEADINFHTLLPVAQKYSRKIFGDHHFPQAVQFPEITGPESKNDRIAVIGAGPSGLHMASLLKLQGYQNVILLEKSGRIGGKVLTVKEDGHVYQMGALHISSYSMINKKFNLGLNESDSSKLSPIKYHVLSDSYSIESGTYSTMNDDQFMRYCSGMLPVENKVKLSVFSK